VAMPPRSQKLRKKRRPGCCWKKLTWPSAVVADCPRWHAESTTKCARTSWPCPKTRSFFYQYFSQTLLPDYIEEHGVSWNVVRDARGHFEEPHTNRSIGCGQ